MPKFLVYLRSREVRSCIIEAASAEQIEDAYIPDDTFHRQVDYCDEVEVVEMLPDALVADYDVREEPDA